MSRVPASCLALAPCECKKGSPSADEGRDHHDDHAGGTDGDEELAPVPTVPEAPGHRNQGEHRTRAAELPTGRVGPPGRAHSDGEQPGERVPRRLALD